MNLALGDIDGDGLLDLAVSNWSQPTVTTFRGLGTGFFEAKSELIAHGYPSEVSLVDLDADGWLDLVVLADGQIDGVGPFCVFHNYGAGAFGPKQLLEMPHDAASFDTGDVNSDGKPDLVVSTFEPQLMSVLQGDGTGGFVPIVPVPIGPQPWTVAAGDLDGDGVDDIVVPAGFAVGVLFSKAGFPAPMVTLPLSHWGFGVAIADLNGDGLRDIAATVQAGKLSYMLNQGGGSFAPALMHDTVNGALYLATGDLNLDGLADLVLPGIWDGGTAVILSTGTGLVNHSVLAPGSQPHDVAIGDVNQDGRPDLVVGNSNVDEVVVYLNECVP